MEPPRAVYNPRLSFSLVNLDESLVSLWLGSAELLVQDIVLELNLDGQPIYLGWSGLPPRLMGTVEFSPVLADLCGIPELMPLDSLQIKRASEVAVQAQEVYLEPVDYADWELLEWNAQYLQDHVLEQTRFVWNEAIIVCYLANGRDHCLCRVTGIHPSGPLSLARLAQDTLLVIKPKRNPRSSIKEASITKLQLKTCLLPRKKQSGVLYTNYLQGDNQWVNLRAFFSPNELKTIGIPSKNWQPRLYAQLKYDEEIPPGYAIISQDLWNHMCNVPPMNNLPITVTIQAAPTVDKTTEVKIYGRCLPEILPRVVTHGMIDFANHVSYSMLGKSNRDVDAFTLLGDKSQIALETKPQIDFSAFSLRKALRIDDIVSEFPTIHTTSITKLHNFLESTSSSMMGMLITGYMGIGKTTLINRSLKDLQKNPPFLYIKYLDCDTFSDSLKLDEMISKVDDLVSTLYWYRPGVLVLDNADSIFSQSNGDNGNYSLPRVSLSDRISNYFIERIQSLKGSVKVVFICDRESDFNMYFTCRHAIQEHLKINELKKSDRVAVIEYYYSKYHDGKKLDESNLAYIIEESREFIISDYDNFFRRLAFETTGDISVILKRALKEYGPANCKNMKLVKNTNVDWDDIGALDSVKNMLMETLEWPTKYAPIYEKCPMRLRSGILLYGYPGCGKTLLASAVAQHCNINFIPVKGPEILNKYIGASEQNVRELFEKAKALKPCIIFFDEFDSVAPKRGHDSTGVTDRVVNQLLTQMDGAEGLDAGVYILAATSRPDLIDPALLRPGRIDKSVLCNIPNRDERLDILSRICNKMNLGDGVDLGELANATEGMCGADLQSLCSNAYTKAAQRHLSTVKFTNRTMGALQDLSFHVIHERNRDETAQLLADQYAADHSSHTDGEAKPIVRVLMSDLQDACKETRPSISTPEYYKLQGIYQKFAQDREGALPQGEASTTTGSRLTLM